jgi:predicted nucleotidyltransferase
VIARMQGGRDYLVSLNREHRLASALVELFRGEAEHFLELRSSLVSSVEPGARGRGVLSVVVFGSAARSQDALGSDLDVLLLARDDKARRAALDSVEHSREALRARFGVSARPIAYAIPEARRLWRARRPPLTEAARDGIVLLGPPLEELLGGES